MLPWWYIGSAVMSARGKISRALISRYPLQNNNDNATELISAFLVRFGLVLNLGPRDKENEKISCQLLATHFFSGPE